MRDILRLLNDNPDYIDRMAKPIEYSFHYRRKLLPFWMGGEYMGELKYKRIPFSDYYNFNIVIYTHLLKEDNFIELFTQIVTHEWLHFLILRDAGDKVLSSDSVRMQENAISELMKKDNGGI
jgi:hypothetical protein